MSPARTTSTLSQVAQGYGPPTVALVTPLRDSGRRSMDLYADGLRQALLALPGRPIDPVVVTKPAFEITGRYVGGRATLLVDRWLSQYHYHQRQVRCLRADLYHITDHSDAHLLRALDPARTVVTCHDLTPIELADKIYPHPVGKLTGRRLFGYSTGFLERAAAVVTVSHSTKASLLRHTRVREERIFVVPLGIDAAFRHLDSGDSGARARRAALGVPLDRPYVLHVGASGPNKNIETVLRAVAATDRDVLLVKVGAGLTDGQRRLAASLGLADKIVPTGTVAQEDVVALYNGATALLFPSLWEGFGWPLLEAMACGTPVVATATSSIPEVVGDAAILHPPCDAAAFAASIDGLVVGSPRRQELIARGHARAATYTWRRTARAMMTVYGQILDRDDINDGGGIA